MALTKIPYQRIQPKEMLLRDYLAIERTVMANERSFLACLRTSLSLVVAGASFIKFSGYRVLEAVGWGLIPLGLALLSIGVRRFLRMRRVIMDIQAGTDAI